MVRDDGLTPREYEALREIATGAPGKVVASRMGISQKTLDIHLRHAREKLGAHNVAQLVAIGFRRGLLVGICALTLWGSVATDNNALRGRGGGVRVARSGRTRRKWVIFA